MGARLGVDFGILLALLVVLSVIGLTRMALLQANLEQIVKNDYVKVALTNTMRDAVRFQAVALRDVVMQEYLSFKKKRAQADARGT